tara:strand:- start:1243 stop:1494 length:252 start_codon:yes stop_codon:yes gene_type:complete
LVQLEGDCRGIEAVLAGEGFFKEEFGSVNDGILTANFIADFGQGVPLCLRYCAFVLRFNEHKARTTMQYPLSVVGVIFSVKKK